MVTPAELGLTLNVPVAPVPVPTSVPPQLPVYHFHDPLRPRLPPVTLSVVLPPLHMVVAVAVALVARVDVSLTSMLMVLQSVV